MICYFGRHSTVYNHIGNAVHATRVRTEEEEEECIMVLKIKIDAHIRYGNRRKKTWN